MQSSERLPPFAVGGEEDVERSAVAVAHFYRCSRPVRSPFHLYAYVNRATNVPVTIESADGYVVAEIVQLLPVTR